METTKKMDSIELLKIELNLLSDIYRNYRNHFKSSILIDRINEVRKLTRRFLISNSKLLQSKLMEKCLDLYVSVSNISVMGHYKTLCIVLFSISARIYRCASQLS
jgi:hypothetical protein